MAALAKPDAARPGKGRLTAQLPPVLHDDMVLNFYQGSTFCGLSVATLRRKVAKGELPVVKLSERRLGLKLGALKAAFAA